MEGGGLFNPGFLGANFLWWVGQVVDDSTWRENILSGKYEDKNSIPGWGRRYKVRIIGLHDQGQETIPDDQLPFANVMYPVTAGGGQAGAKQTPQIRQGNMVFGFFLDGQDQQVPVIMGILGNNSQTTLSQKTGDNKVTNSSPGNLAESGYSTGAVEKKGTEREVPPDYDKVIKQPARKPGQPDQEAGANAPPEPGATNENEAVHQIDASDVKRQEKCDEKIVLMKPDPEEVVNSAMKGMQTAIENLTTKIDKVLQALQSYVDAVSLATEFANMQKLIEDASAEIAKYMRIIFDKIMQYVLKILNEGLTKVVALLPSSMRYQFADMKEVLTELILCLYGKLTGKLGDLVKGALEGAINISSLEQEVKELISEGSTAQTNPKVPMCYAEGIASAVLAAAQPDIDDANNNLVENLDAYLEDISGMLAGVSGALSEIDNVVPSISGSITSALSFANLKFSVFGCELDPSKAVSDYYTFCSGGDSQAPSQLPSKKSIDDATTAKAKDKDSAATGSETKTTPFVEPTSGTEDVTVELY